MLVFHSGPNCDLKLTLHTTYAKVRLYGTEPVTGRRSKVGKGMVIKVSI